MIRKQNDIVGTLFQDIAHLIRQRIDTELQPFGLTRLKWLAIGLVQMTPGMTQSELAARLELKPAATGKLVDRLEGRGLVMRQPDPDDRRVHRLFITEKSENLLIELEPVGDAIREDVLQDLGSKERKQLEDLMKRLKQRLVQTAASAFAVILNADALTWATTMPTI